MKNLIYLSLISMMALCSCGLVKITDTSHHATIINQSGSQIDFGYFFNTRSTEKMYFGPIANGGQVECNFDDGSYPDSYDFGILSQTKTWLGNTSVILPRSFTLCINSNGTSTTITKTASGTSQLRLQP